MSQARILNPRIPSGRRAQLSLRLDPIVYAQVRAALAPLGISHTVLIERLLLDFVRRNKTPAAVATAIAGLPRQDAL